ncbi:unnamed protein product [Linum tenue]|uniref:Uncharacterized protein n=1 Tax=Linum tenue TaxID=586396 RepID=A0AAV0KST1_9ROSI|nr:unnamed protein product [Linum tenue]
MYSLSYGPGLSELWKAPHCHSVQLDSISRHVQKPEDTDDEYLQWYVGRTHSRIVCPSVGDQEIHHHLTHDQLAVKLVREFRTVLSTLMMTTLIFFLDYEDCLESRTRRLHTSLHLSTSVVHVV